MSDKSLKYKSVLLPVLIIAVAWAVYAPVSRCEFVSLDDEAYVTLNQVVRGGVSLHGIRTALTQPVAGNWHPLTMLSHMVDSEIFRSNPAGHHLVSLFLHLLNTLILYLLLRAATGATWRSAMVAALFALHPLNVESVAWVSQRKTVLSTLFWFLTMYAYVGYTRRPGTSRYVLILVLFTLGLLAKPMLVTLPVVLVLMDYWPLERFGKDGAKGPGLRKLILEKVPMLAIAGVFGLITILAQRSAGAVSTVATLPVSIRISNAVISYFRYLDRMIWPSKLAVFYPFSHDSLSTPRVILFAVVLLGMTVYVLSEARRKKYLLVGWLWYLITMLPVIGLLQVGAQSSADRYAYVTLIGVFILIAWGLADWSRGKKSLQQPVALTVICFLIVISVVTRFQLRYWKNSYQLYIRAIQTTKDNYLCYNNLATLLAKNGQDEEALQLVNAAIQIAPQMIHPYMNKGELLAKKGDIKGAREAYEAGLRMNPESPMMHNQIGNFFYKYENFEEAAFHYREALFRDESLLVARSNLGAILARQGRYDEAVEEFAKVLAAAPYSPAVLMNMGMTKAHLGQEKEALGYLRQSVANNPLNEKARATYAWLLNANGYPEEAVAEYETALQMKGDLKEGLNGLAWILATSPETELRNPARAIELAEAAIELPQGRSAEVLDTLSAAYAADGRFDDAVKAAEEALSIVKEVGLTDVAKDIEARLAGYRAGRAYIDPGHAL
ncbi:MAG: tetratricopeptide repeat protein [Verrucomicrobia bacterium]|nr:tetratricopeptide repeat protein [Verrucomicrobiota bacterium]